MRLPPAGFHLAVLRASEAREQTFRCSLRCVLRLYTPLSLWRDRASWEPPSCPGFPINTSSVRFSLRLSLLRVPDEVPPSRAPVAVSGQNWVMRSQFSPTYLVCKLPLMIRPSVRRSRLRGVVSRTGMYNTQDRAVNNLSGDLHIVHIYIFVSRS